MTDFFKHPILNSPYAYPSRHWELDADGQPTNKIIETRRKSDLITQVPKAKKQRTISQDQQNLDLRDKIKALYVFHPQTGEIAACGPDEIACWFIDTDYNEESFFVRHAYFLGANDPYKALKTILKAEVDQEAWESLYSDISRPFEKPQSGRIAVKVINHLGDEVMKVFGVL